MKKGTCKHFTDEHLFTHCQAGIRYREVMSRLQPRAGAATKEPCVQANVGEYAAALTTLSAAPYGKSACCDKYEEPTATDIAAHQKKRQADLVEVRKIVPLLGRIKSEYQGKDWAGIQACPICHQQLFVQHFGVDDRTWGKCETTGCVAWLE